MYVVEKVSSDKSLSSQGHVCLAHSGLIKWALFALIKGK